MYMQPRVVPTLSGLYENSCGSCVWQEPDSMKCSCDVNIPTTGAIDWIPSEVSPIVQDTVINLGFDDLRLKTDYHNKLIQSVDEYISNLNGDLTASKN
jgi:hypothetical protein